ncbi:MAG: methylated-DNA--[Clostridia bacterium]|nr:methylated-DNA--[protein]-cysteine S-methyltransferase [Clostridia bacterium]
MDYTHSYLSPLGRITLASDGESLTGLWFPGQKYFASTLGAEHEEKSLPIFTETDRWLRIYFGGKEPDFTPTLRMRGTAFRKAVWSALLGIPYGRTATYGDIARQLGLSPMYARAVGSAAGHNPLSIIIPCHRVVGADGSLTGYAGGLDRKIKLLALEHSHSANAEWYERKRNQDSAFFRCINFL